MVCDGMKPIKVFRGDDTDFNYNKLLTIILESTFDLTGFKCSFQLGYFKLEDVDISSGRLEINFTAEDTKRLRYGLLFGTFRLYDTQGRVQTVTNTIPFEVTNKVFTPEHETVTLVMPPHYPINVQLQIGDVYATKTELAAEKDAREDADSQLQAGLNTKLDITEAASTYATQTALSTGLAGKQDTLSTDQLAAVNSGVTTSTVSQVATNLNYLTGFAPYIQKYEVGNFNTQQTVDATDLLAATGALHALDLDLSKNTQLKKLTAKGTSGNLANVSSVLVSNEAPFDNATSPQLDVSYTGLNRAALVNLFNSMPYNVGYTVVGSPTITDGVVSGFSSSNKITLNGSFTNMTSLDFKFKFKLNSNTGSRQYIYADNTGDFLIYANSSLGLVLYIQYPSGTSEYFYWPNTPLSLNTDYYITGSITANAQRIGISTDDENYTYTDFTKTIGITDAFLKGSFGMSYANAGILDGSIDLNKTYISPNNALFFTGKAAMTKTCSVVGCTGTADLTQDDKNIALNKGWALTVA